MSIIGAQRAGWSEVDEAGTLTGASLKEMKMLLISLNEHRSAPTNACLFVHGAIRDPGTLCLLPLTGKTMLGVLKLAQCERKVFTTANLKLLRQIAERCIAVDNALAYRESTD